MQFTSNNFESQGKGVVTKEWGITTSTKAEGSSISMMMEDDDGAIYIFIHLT